VAELLSLLLRCVGGEEECATVMSECLGQLALLAPDQVGALGGDAVYAVRALVAAMLRAAHAGPGRFG